MGYLVSHRREWDAGFAQKRIDEIVDMLHVADAGTVHVDAFYPLASPFHKVTEQDDARAMLEIVKYWHQKGVDVTMEWLQYDFVGYVPYAYHFNPDEAGRLKYPASVVCGGGPEWSYRNDPKHPFDWAIDRPDPGCLYEEAWGYSIDSDASAHDRQADRLVKGFYRHTLPFLFLNGHKRLSCTLTNDAYEVAFSDNVRSTVRTTDRHLTIRQGSRTLLDGGDMCIDALWAGRACIAYSEDGGSKTWQLPAAWEAVRSVRVRTLTADGPTGAGDAAVSEGCFTLEMPAGQALLIEAPL